MLKLLINENRLYYDSKVNSSQLYDSKSGTYREIIKFAKIDIKVTTLSDEQEICTIETEPIIGSFNFQRKYFGK